MCDPTTIALTSMGIGAAQAGAGFLGARASAKAANKAAAENAQNTSDAAEANYALTNSRAVREGEASFDQAQQLEIEKAQALASTEVAAQAGGVGGLAVGAALRDVYSQAGRSKANLKTNIQMGREALDGQLRSIHDNAQSGANSMPGVENPSILPFALQGFSSGLNAYTTKLNMEND